MHLATPSFLSILPSALKMNMLRSACWPNKVMEVGLLDELVVADVRPHLAYPQRAARKVWQRQGGEPVR